MLTTITMQSPVGVLRLFARGDQLAGVYLPDQPVPAATASRGDAPRVLENARAQLAEYFAGTRQTFDLPLAAVGTEFQQIVWRALATIPFGETWTYGALATAIDRPSASRAVGAANGKNPLSIIVPCHRVIGSSGELTGYAGGMAAKKWLLEHERAHTRPRAGTTLAMPWA